MDPNENLKCMLRFAESLVDIDTDEMNKEELVLALWRANRLAELVLALNDWIRRGGFAPSNWS